ncbi:hypothetical protein GEMRC1_010410 [Eukaryota sp. GEM-RC1]
MTLTPRRLALRQAENISAQINSIDSRLDSSLKGLNSRFSKLLENPPQYSNEYGFASICPSQFDTIISLRHFVDFSVDKANRLVEDDSRWKKNLTPQHLLSLILSGNLTRRPNTELTLAALELNSGRRLHERMLRQRSWTPGPITAQHETELEKFVRKRRNQLKTILSTRQSVVNDRHAKARSREQEISCMELEDLRSSTIEDVQKEKLKARSFATEHAKQMLKHLEVPKQLHVTRDLSDGLLTSAEMKELLDSEAQKVKLIEEEHLRRDQARKAALEATAEEKLKENVEQLMREELSNMIDDEDSHDRFSQKFGQNQVVDDELFENFDELARSSAKNVIDSSIASDEFSNFVQDKIHEAKLKIDSLVTSQLQSSEPVTPITINASATPSRLRSTTTSSDLSVSRDTPKITSTKIKELLRELSQPGPNETEEQQAVRLAKLEKLKKVLKKRLKDKRQEDHLLDGSDVTSPTVRLRADSFAEFLKQTTDSTQEHEETLVGSRLRTESVQSSIEERQLEREKRRELKKQKSLAAAKSLL